MIQACITITLIVAAAIYLWHADRPRRIPFRWLLALIELEDELADDPYGLEALERINQRLDTGQPLHWFEGDTP
jgi:hypothetical protein